MSLSQIIQHKQTECFNKYGVFFAFSNKQMDEQKKPDTTYVSLGSGTICPKENAEAFVDEHHQIVLDGIAEDIRINGKAKIIRRELENHECFYTGEIDDCVAALEDYGFTVEEIYEEFRKGE